MSAPNQAGAVDTDAYVDAAAALIGLPIPPENLEGVRRYYGIAAQMAALVMQHPLGPEDEAAAIFVPVAPDHP
jgi:hypothetical protein